MIYLMFAILLFAAHYVGDFVMQRREVALNKSHDNLALLEHGVWLSVPMILVFFIIYAICHS